MSDRRFQTGCMIVFLRCFIGAAILFTTLPAAAFDPAAPFDDPLQALPDRIGTGVSLPGDSRPAPCPAVKDFAMPLALTEAVDLALCNNPQIKAAWAAIKIQAGAVGEARAAYLPTLSGTVNQMKTDTNYPGSKFPSTSTNGQGIYGTLSWRLFDFGGRSVNRESANSLLIASIATHDATLQKTLSGVVQAYFDAHTAKAALQAKKQDESIAEHTLEIAKRREVHGAVSHGDILQATTALAKASLDKNRAIGGYRKAMAVLVYSLGVPMQTSVILPDDLSDKEALEPGSLEEWLQMAGKTNPAILAARAQWEASKQKIISTRSDSLPTVDFSASFYQNGYPGQGLSPTKTEQEIIGVAISFPLFDGFSRTYKIRGAEAQAEQNEARLKDTEENTLMEIVKAHADATSSLLNLQASEKLLGAARDSLQSSQRRYEKGVADIPEILQTQTALADARQERIRSLAEWRSARLRLLASVGIMGRGAVAQ